MKRLTGLLVLLFIGILVLSAGCTGIPGSSKAASPAPAAPVMTQQTGITGTNWTGSYMTTWTSGSSNVRMVLVQSKNVVIGTYEYSGGTVTGIADGNRLVGTWSQDNGASKGPFEFEMKPDGKTFAGWWAYEGADFARTKLDPPSWTGVRVA